MNMPIRLWHLLLAVVCMLLLSTLAAYEAGSIVQKNTANSVRQSTADSVRKSTEDSVREATDKTWKQMLPLCPPNYYEEIYLHGRLRVTVAADGKTLVAIDDTTQEFAILFKSEMTLYDPVWSKKGSFIIFTGQTSDGVANLWRINEDGTGAKQLTSFTDLFVYGFQAYLSPNEQLLVFMTNAFQRLWIIDATGGNQRLLIDHLGVDPSDKTIHAQTLFPTFIDDTTLAYHAKNTVENTEITVLLHLETMTEESTWSYCGYHTH